MDSLKLNIDSSIKEDVTKSSSVFKKQNSSFIITDDDLAIVGIACRFPGGSNSIDEFWSNLVEQHDCVRPIPSDRWNADYYTDPSSNELHLPAKIPSSRCGWIDFLGEFDYETFSISKREAENMDPQQKLLLEVTLQALEDSGIQYAGSKTGVYVGIGQAEQYELTTADLESINAYSVTGSALSISSNRISYCFDLRGPSMSVDTACSSSLTAFHLACQAIRDGTCSAAVVAGVNIIMNPSTVIQFSQLGVLSPDGKCQSFSNKANGYVRSEGCGVVIVKPLKQALVDNDHIYCRIRGSAINQDGHQSPSLTMPSSQAQVEVFQMACRNGKVNPTEIFYAEAHATGTRVGDPTEANAIGTVFGRQQSYLRIGSVKSNVGHLETASFMAGLLKCILMLEHQQLVPNIHFTQGEGNSDIKFEQYKLSVQTEIENFENSEELMMISSFGFGGANGCAIIQGYKQSSEQAQTSSLPQLFLVSASTPHALEARIQELKSSSKTFNSPAAISHTLYNRTLHRLVTFAISEQLDENTTFVPTRKCVDQPLACIWVFAGQGPQHPKMGKILYSNVESFRRSIDASDSIYLECSGHSLIHDIGLFGSTDGSNPMAVYEIAYTLPALVFLQIALVDMYRHLGVPCVAVFGHSFGEMAAGYAANICTRKQCIETAYHRARILRQTDGRGAMLAVSCSSEDIQPLLNTHEQIWIAAYNSPNSLTLGGIKESITSISNELTKQNIFNRVLKINSAYHTQLMAPVRSEALSVFKQTLAGCSAPTIPYFSTVTGQWKDSDFDENYAFDGIEGPVLFDVAVRQCLERFGIDTSVFLEISAHPVLSSYLTENGSKYNLCTLNRQQADIETTLKTLANLRIYGYSPAQANISKIYSSTTALSRIPHYSLYPFQRQYCVKEDPAHRLQRTVPIWHSLAGRPLAHPDTTFQTKLSLKSYVWLQDHRVQGPVVFPAAAYIEICMEVFNCMSLTNIHIEKALILPSDLNTYRTVRIVLSDNNQSHVAMYSKLNEYDSGNWTKHMKASKGDSSASSTQLPEWPTNLKSRCTLTMIEQKDVYGRFSSVGLDYGSYFQCIRTLYQGDNEAYAHLNISHLPKPLPNSKQSRFNIHPAILDCAFQVLLGTQRYFHTAYVPTFIERIEWKIETSELPNDFYVYARTKDTDSKQVLTGDIFVIDEQQQRLIGMIIGFEATALGQSNQPQPLYTLCYQNVETPIITTTTTKSYLNTIEIPTGIKEQETLFDNACSAYIAAFLASNPFDSSTIDKWPVHRQRYWQWLHSTIKSKQILPESIELIDHQQCEALSYEAQAIHRVGKNLHLLLSDNFAVQNIFFGDNDPFMSDLYSKSMTFQPYTHILAQKLVDQFKLIQEQQPSESSRVFSILELGAGTGALTSVILEKLYQQTTIIQENRLIYVFTDVSGKFLSDAKKRFSKIYPCIQYQLCNLDVDLTTQKLNMYSFDVVCAFDVLHVAQDLKLCLNRVQQLLKPNGYLLCIELTRPWTWIQFFFGLFAGWWHFSDTTIRSTCFLTVDKWHQLLTESGFQHLEIENEGEPEFAHSLLHARSSNWTTIRTPSNITIFDTTEATVMNANTYMEKLLKLAQSLITVTEPTTVFVITLITTPPIGATFTGFTRVWANEATQHIICSIEFDFPEFQEKKMWLNRIETIVDRTCEREFIIRQNKIIVPRHISRSLRNAITRGITTNDQKANPCSIQYEKQPFRLEIDTIGQLQTLKYRSFHSSPSLSPDDVQVEVHASALNFKDLMLALGMLENPMGFDKETLKYHESSVNLGLEFSGIVTGLGSTASHTFKIGDLVFGFANHCFSSQIVTHQHFVVKKPSSLSHTDAVSLPIVFATVYAGLVVKAQLKRGETVLIHSAAGGIGQAAIQLSQYLGARVICTVGSNEKREFLKKTYGCTQFANSHSTEEWKSDVLKLTNGQGVDIVLNSLKGDAIKAGLECLRTGGRFIEIGKVDILNHSKLDMNLLLRDLSFLSVQLDILMQSQTETIQRYLQAVTQLASEKHISPIVDSVYQLKDTEVAFRFLMSGQHKGKLILNMQSQPSNVYPSSSIYSSSVCYILSGGTGALGLQLVQHMSSHGARLFILLSRQGTASLRPSDAAMLARLKRFGIQIYIGKADVAELEDIQRVLKEAQEKLLFTSSCKYSILHLAMVLDDAPILKLNIQRMENVMQCKVQGAINLLQSIPDDKLEEVIFFSSAASTFGNPSQANYSAANTFLDTYADQLSKSARKKARVLNLGLVEDVGILAEDWKLKQILTAKGFAGGLTSSGVAQLVDHAFLLDNDDDEYQMLYGNFQMEDLIRSYPILKTRLEHLIDHTVSNSNGNPGTSSNDNEVTVQSLAAYVSTLLATSNLDVTESLTVQGLDSLLAVELSAGLKKQFGLVISQLALLGGLSVKQIVESASS